MNLSFVICREFGAAHQKLLAMPFNLPRFHKIRFHGFFVNGKTVMDARKYCTVNACTSSQLKKQPFKKKSLVGDAESLKITAFSAAQEFDLDSLSFTLKDNGRYRLSNFNKELTDSNVVHLNLGRSLSESKDIFVFREGSVVLWNFQEPETMELLNFLKKFHKGSFSEKITESENEFLTYIPCESSKTSLRGGKIVLSKGENETLEKFAISNAMALSVHLGAYENLLNDYIDSMLPVTEDLKSGRAIKMSQREVLMKMGQLFSLKHVINLSSDLLDTPDFYWDREELETLYQRTFNYFCIRRRTQVMNEKINHCVELVQLLSTQLSDAHHVRLEWMIIVLIMVEVCFEVFHYLVTYGNLMQSLCLGNGETAREPWVQVATCPSMLTEYGITVMLGKLRPAYYRSAETAEFLCCDWWNLRMSDVYVRVRFGNKVSSKTEFQKSKKIYGDRIGCSTAYFVCENAVFVASV